MFSSRALLLYNAYSRTPVMCGALPAGPVLPNSRGGMKPRGGRPPAQSEGPLVLPGGLVTSTTAAWIWQTELLGVSQGDTWAAHQCRWCCSQPSTHAVLTPETQRVLRGGFCFVFPDERNGRAACGSKPELRKSGRMILLASIKVRFNSSGTAARLPGVRAKGGSHGEITVPQTLFTSLAGHCGLTSLGRFLILGISFPLTS